MRSNIAPARLDVGYVFNAGGSTVKSDNVSVRSCVGFPFNAGGQKDTNSSTGCRAAFASLQRDRRDRYW